MSVEIFRTFVLLKERTLFNKVNIFQTAREQTAQSAILKRVCIIAG